MKKENNELNNGDNERRGMVRLKSDSNIAFKNKRADKRLMKIKINPGKNSSLNLRKVLHKIPNLQK